MARVALYERVSTLDQAEEGYSIDEQESRLKKYCEIKDWQVHKVYKDPGFSGSNLKRPGIEALILDCKLHKFDTFLVYKLDRLSRSQKDTLHLIEDVFNSNNVAFISLNESFDTSTPFGKASIGILSVFAQLEREQIRERMVMGKIGRAKSGKVMNWSAVPFGYVYSNDTYTIDEFRAGIVKSIYKSYLSGMSITKLKDKLNAEGHLGKSVKWSYRTVRQVLGNSTYTGVTKYRKKEYPAQFEAIIDKITYEETQKELVIRQQQAYEKNHNPRPFQAKYMLSGLLECGYCTAALGLRIYSKRKDGSRSKFYKCPSAVQQKTFTQRQYAFCEAPFYDKEKLEVKVIKAIRELQFNPQLVSDLYNGKKTDSTSILNEISKVDHKLEKLLNLYVDSDSFSRQVYDRKRETLQDEKSKLEAKLSKTGTQKPEFPVKKAIEFIEEQGDILKADYELQKKIVRKLISKIIVKGDSISVKWRFQV